MGPSKAECLQLRLKIQPTSVGFDWLAARCLDRSINLRVGVAKARQFGVNASFHYLYISLVLNLLFSHTVQLTICCDRFDLTNEVRNLLLKCLFEYRSHLYSMHVVGASEAQLMSLEQ